MAGATQISGLPISFKFLHSRALLEFHTFVENMPFRFNYNLIPEFLCMFLDIVVNC